MTSKARWLAAREAEAPTDHAEAAVYWARIAREESARAVRHARVAGILAGVAVVAWLASTALRLFVP